MVRLTRGRKRTALGLFGVLLVLPTIVLGGLHWRQLELDHQAMLGALPLDAQDAARRLEDALERRVRELIEREDARPFYEYKLNFAPPDTLGADLAFIKSPLHVGPVPTQILGWFAWTDSRDGRARPPVVLQGGRAKEWLVDVGQGGIQAAVQHAIWLEEHDFFLRRVLRQRGVRVDDFPLPTVALNLGDSENIESIDCMRDELPALRGLQGVKQEVQTSSFHLRFYVERDGTPRILATRVVTILPNKHLANMPSCFEAIGAGAKLRQGFFVDPTWLFRDLPATLAAQVLEGSQHFLPAGAEPDAIGPGSAVFSIRPIKALSIETYRKEDDEFGTLRIAVNKHDLEGRFRTQTFRFLGVAAMLVVSLATGLILLLRSVSRELEAARRTENFVAAVTHELRTPLAAIKMYGEMLHDGWVDDPDKRAEYYRRIVRETGRLETLVENVLEKSQIARREAAPEPGDLNAAIESIAGSLKGIAPEGQEDLAFELAEDLPFVMLIPEAVRSIVTNLVENARKYAPMKLGVAGSEPILVRTHVLAENVVLDVLDRGPGIPHEERSRIFEAFYRVGNEHTRTTRGTGLGLHLVALQSQAMGARVAVMDRKGGGTVFRVTFATAPDERTPS